MFIDIIIVSVINIYLSIFVSLYTFSIYLDKAGFLEKISDLNRLFLIFFYSLPDHMKNNLFVPSFLFFSRIKSFYHHTINREMMMTTLGDDNTDDDDDDFR